MLIVITTKHIFNGGYTMTEAQKRAKAKYRKKVNRLSIDFHPTEDELWEHINKQQKKQTYIKDLVRRDMKGE